MCGAGSSVRSLRVPAGSSPREDDAPFELGRRLAVNAAGLHAQGARAAPHRTGWMQLTSRAAFLPAAATSSSRGARRSPRLIYPTRAGRTRRCTLTLDLGARRASVLTSNDRGYRLHRRPAAARTPSTPRCASTGHSCPMTRFAPAYAGIRPKLAGPGGPARLVIAWATRTQRARSRQPSVRHRVARGSRRAGHSVRSGPTDTCP